METGAVLVASLTTPAWTPLFARASAVVTDIGGPLSHGSIVAREYGIPAVLGTGAATATISSGQIITVDGSQGLVIINKGETPLDNLCHLRFDENIGEVLPPAVQRLKELTKSS